MTTEKNNTAASIAELVSQAQAVRETLALKVPVDLEATLHEKFLALIDRIEGAPVTSLDDAFAKARAARQLDPQGFQTAKESELASRLSAQAVDWLASAEDVEARSKPACRVVDLGEAYAANEERMLDVDAMDLGEAEYLARADLMEIDDYREALLARITQTKAEGIDGAAIQVAAIERFTDRLAGHPEAEERAKARRAIRRLVYSALRTLENRVDADCHITGRLAPGSQDPFKSAEQRLQVEEQDEEDERDEVKARQQRRRGEGNLTVAG